MQDCKRYCSDRYTDTTDEEDARTAVSQTVATASLTEPEFILILNRLLELTRILIYIPRKLTVR